MPRTPTSGLAYVSKLLRSLSAPQAKRIPNLLCLIGYMMLLIEKWGVPYYVDSTLLSSEAVDFVG